MFVLDGDVEVLARAMIKNFPADAADRAALRSNAFFVLGRTETSRKWMQVSEEIERIQAGQNECPPSTPIGAPCAGGI